MAPPLVGVVVGVAPFVGVVVVLALSSNIVDGIDRVLFTVPPTSPCRLSVSPPLKLAVIMAMCTLLERPLLKVAF